jgi:Mor family transcriptional regulator
VHKVPKVQLLVRQDQKDSRVIQVLRELPKELKEQQVQQVIQVHKVLKAQLQVQLVEQVLKVPKVLREEAQELKEPQGL